MSAANSAMEFGQYSPKRGGVDDGSDLVNPRAPGGGWAAGSDAARSATTARCSKIRHDGARRHGVDLADQQSVEDAIASVARESRAAPIPSAATRVQLAMVASVDGTVMAAGGNPVECIAALLSRRPSLGAS